MSWIHLALLETDKHIVFQLPMEVLYGTAYAADQNVPKFQQVFFNLKRLFWQHPERHGRQVTVSNVCLIMVIMSAY